MDIIETPNENIPTFKVIPEKMDKYVPGIPEGISRRNGMINVLCGSGGSGKTNLLLNMFKSGKLYRGKFDYIYYICPESSILSVEKHPFDGHDKTYHELTIPLLESIYETVTKMKKEEEEPKYTCIFIDDMADELKNNDIQNYLKKFLIKSRHLCCSFIFTLQSYFYFPKICRKQITYITIFKPKNTEEYESLAKELIGLNKENGLILYDFIFDKPYNHLDIDTVEGKYYKNFNELTFLK